MRVFGCGLVSVCVCVCVCVCVSTATLKSGQYQTFSRHYSNLDTIDTANCFVCCHGNKDPAGNATSHIHNQVFINKINVLVVKTKLSLNPPA